MQQPSKMFNIGYYTYSGDGQEYLTVIDNYSESPDVINEFTSSSLKHEFILDYTIESLTGSYGTLITPTPASSSTLMFNF
jgi:hypothetical protein